MNATPNESIDRQARLRGTDVAVRHHSWTTPEGRLAADVYAPSSGPLVVLLPGMGDTRGAYRHLVPLLAERGFRVVTLDLPGHGESDVGSEPSQWRVGEHAAALVASLGGPAIVVGHSFTPDSALVASLVCDEVHGVVCLAPWASAPQMPGLLRMLSGLVARSPFLWSRFYRSQHKQVPADLDAHLKHVRRALGRPGGTLTLQRMASGAGRDAESARARVRVPVTVVMGERDPDFDEPAREAEAYAQPCRATVRMVAGVGHYPHAEAPVAVAEAIVDTAVHAGLR